jgi:protocatechuate 3,4-dioxygenase beta subunit
MGSAYMRFRLSTAGGLSPIGSAADGEVEDYVTPLGAIGNYVWVDENSDGYQDAGEPGLPNMRIWLRDSNGAIIGETWTDAHGGYLFPNLPPGSYLVDVDETSLPAGMTQTPFNLPGADFGNQDQSGLGYPVAIGGTQPLENLTADFGYNYNPTGDVDNPPSGATAALGDRVWIDVNGDGRQDPEEVGVREATVQLFTAGDDSLFGTADDVAGPTQTTDANGYYLFDDLQPGAYVVKVVSSASASHDVLGASYTQTGDPDHFGTTGSSNDNMTTTPVVLGPGDVFLNADFGYQPNAGVTLGTIGDTVWFDANASGTAAMDAGEYGIPGVTVALIRDTNGNGVWDAGEPVIAIDTTDASGQYLFSGLALSDDGDGDGADADYIVWVNDTDAVLTGLRQTYDQDAPLDNRSATALSAGTPQDLAQDFSYTAAGHTPATGLIGDTVWFDLNNSGGATQHAGEPGIEGVVMELVDGSGNVLATTTTDENGHYYFGGLPVSAGGIQYQVQVAASNFAAGGVLQGLAETYAAGGAVGGNQGNLVTLTTASPIDLAQDFSYTATIDPGRIGNLVWLDQNADGVFTTVDGPDGLPGTDDDEPALGDVTVDLYRDLNCNGRVDPVDPRLSTQTTASAIDAGLYGADGVYIFNRLATVGACGDNAAGYVVNVTDTAGLLAGYWHSLGTAGQDNHSQVDPYAAQISAAQVDNLTADFGYYVEPACVGNFVWYDQDGDSLQDVGELGLNGVTLQLAISWPAGGNTTLKVATGDNPKQSGTQAGWYSFCNLLQDEDYPIGSSTMAPATNQPAHVLSVASAPAGYAPTGIGGADSDEGTVPLDDSNNHAGTVGVPVHGLTDVSQQAAGSEPAIASYDFGYRDVQLAVLLASFDAVVQPDHVLVIWETVSEVNNAGFNLYRSLSADGEQVLLAFTPSAAPGSAAGAAYRLQDFAVQAGQAYWYWLEAVDLDGAPTRFDPASVTFQVPTAVTAGPLAADSGTANAAALPGVALALLLALAATTLLRRHQDAAP